MADVIMPDPWVKIPGYRNYAHPDGTIMGVTGKPLKPKWNKAIQYWWVKARSEDGRCETATVHVLMALAFRGPRPSPTHQSRHWDGDRHNNTRENILWGTPKENKQDDVRLGNTRLGAKHRPESIEKMRQFRLSRGGCNPGCTCGIHTRSGSKPCPKGCACGKHRKTT